MKALIVAAALTGLFGASVAAASEAIEPAAPVKIETVAWRRGYYGGGYGYRPYRSYYRPYYGGYGYGYRPYARFGGYGGYGGYGGWGGGYYGGGPYVGLGIY